MRRYARSVGSLIAVSALLSPLLAGQAVAQGNVDFDAAQSSLYAAAYKTERDTRWMGFQSLMRLSQGEVAGSLRETQRLEAWVSRSYGDSAATVRTTSVEASGKKVTESRGSIPGGPQQTDAMTVWLAPVAQSKMDERIVKQLPAQVRYVTAPAKGTIKNSFLPDGVHTSLMEMGAVPWSAEEAIWLCDIPAPDFTVDCEGSVSGSGREKTWTFAVTTDSPDVGAVRYDIEASSDAEGYLTTRSVTTTSGDGYVVKTETSGEVKSPAWSVPNSPVFTSVNTIASDKFGRIAGRAVIKELARNFRNRVAMTLADAGKRLTAKNAEWATTKLSRVDPSWWTPDSAYSTWNSSLGWGKSGNGSFLVSTTIADGITTVNMTGALTIENGKWRLAVSQDG